MADFRKWLFAFALVALLLGVGTANAQNPVTAAFSCVANAGNPVIVRSEGLTELVGDLLLQCTGGNPTAAGVQVPVSNVTLTLNTNITSRLLGGGFMDALLLIDEPYPAVPHALGAVNIPTNSPAQTVCYSSTSPASTAACNYLTGTGGGAYGSPSSPYVQPGAFTIYVGRQAAANQVTWLGIPIDAPGTTGNRVIRLTNVRGNACQLGLSSTLIPTQIVGFVAINGSQFITINNPQQTLAYIQQGLIVSGKSATPQQCVNLNVGNGNGGNFFGGSTTGTVISTVTVKEGFAASFKRQQFTGSVAVGPLPVTGALSQNIPGLAYNTEAAFQPDAVAVGGGTSAVFGQATAGTRILLRFNNVGAGIRLVLPTIVPLSTNNSISAPAPGNPIPVSSLAGWTGGFLQLVGSTSDQFGNVTQITPTGTTSFSGVAAGFSAAVEIPVNTGVATAVYEVVNADPSAVEQGVIGVGVAFVSNTANNLPAPGVSTVHASFAPLSTVGTADGTSPIPRFCDQSSDINILTIGICTCNLLFPFVTQAPGFDTGIAIANTSLDPFGTTPQTGPVTLYFYGQEQGGAAVPTSLASMTTTGSVPAGQVLTYTTFSGAGAFGAGLQANPGFTGYVIAVAKFQYCHGFAFISDLGAQKLAEGYLAIQLDTPQWSAAGVLGIGATRTGTINEDQGN